MRRTQVRSDVTLGRSTFRRRQAGFSNVAALALLVLLGAGVWNYFQSYRDDTENPRSRPFESYSTPDLISLQEAYAGQTERNREAAVREQKTRGKPQRASGSPHRLSDRVKILEEQQAAAGALRNARADFAESEARLGEVEAELQRRSELLSPLRIHMERLFRRDSATAGPP
jgi:hypothetical protein